LLLIFARKSVGKSGRITKRKWLTSTSSARTDLFGLL
jgi:hypothetical protein